MKKRLIISFLSLSIIFTMSACAESPVESTESSAEVSVSEDDIVTSVSENIPVDREEEFEVSKDLKEITLGKYEQDNNTDNGSEAIEWIVLETDGDKALILSKKILDCKPFNKGFAECTWETSSLREWLNSDFLNSAFTESEQARILESFVPDTEPEEDGTGLSGNGIETADVSSGDVSGASVTAATGDGSENAGTEGDGSETAEAEITGTTDKVFLLSDFEVLKYLPDDPEAEGDEPYAEPTEYAKAAGVWTLTEELYKDKDFDDLGLSENGIGCSWWWLRTSGSVNTKALDMDTFGRIRENGHDVGECHDGVRPAMWITLN